MLPQSLCNRACSAPALRGSKKTQSCPSATVFLGAGCSQLYSQAASASGDLMSCVPCATGGATQLLRGRDSNKDQSYFLASVPASALQHFLFPLGSMRKSDVRALAGQANLISATRRSSAGLCFIGEPCSSSYNPTD